MALMDFLGGIGTAYKGYTQGAAAEVERQQKELRNDAERRRIEDEAALAPLVQQQRMLKARADIEQANADAANAPTRREMDRKKLDAEAGMQDTQIDMAKRQLAADAEKQVRGIGLDVANGVIDEQQAQDKIFALVGQKMERGDYAGIAHVMRSAQNMPTFAGTKQYGDIVDVKPINASAGATDLAGSPITGPALQATFSNGKTGLIQTTGFSAAYSQQLRSQYKPIISKPGQTARDPLTGKVIWKNDDAPPRNYIRDEDGNLVYMGGGIGGGSGAGVGGSRAGGKAADPMKAANDAWKTIATDSENKLSSEINARGRALTEQLVTENASMPASKAAEIALDVATHPEKSSAKIDLASGRIHEVYSDKRNGDVVISRDMTDVPKEQMQMAVTKMLADMGNQGNTPDERAKAAKARDMVAAAAFDDKVREELFSGLDAQIDEDAKKQADANPKQRQQILDQADQTKARSRMVIERKLKMIKDYGQPPKAKSDKKEGGFFTAAGGLTDFKPKDGTPAELQDRMRAMGDSQAAATKKKSDEDAAKNEAKEREKADAEQAIGYLTPGAIRAMTKAEAREIRNGKYWKYISGDMQRMLTRQSD